MSPEQSSATDGNVRTVDARGQRCPMPLLMAKRALNALDAGERLWVLATDATAPRDFETFARQSGQALLAINERDGEYHLLLEKS